MELYQSVIAKRRALLFPLSRRVNLPWRTSLLHASLHYFHIISHPEKLQKESHMAEYHQRDRERKTRGAANGNGCYFHATFDFPLRVTGISLFIFRLLNYIPINKLPAHLGSLIYHSIDFAERTTPSSSILWKRRRTNFFFFSSLLKRLEEKDLISFEGWN